MKKTLKSALRMKKRSQFNEGSPTSTPVSDDLGDSDETSIINAFNDVVEKVAIIKWQLEEIVDGWTDDASEDFIYQIDLLNDALGMHMLDALEEIKNAAEELGIAVTVPDVDDLSDEEEEYEDEEYEEDETEEEEEEESEEESEEEEEEEESEEGIFDKLFENYKEEQEDEEYPDIADVL